LHTFNTDDVAFNTGIKGDIARFSLAEKETLYDDC
jgi:hypothetical protein